MSNYPPGTGINDPRAPWNQDEGCEFEHLGGHEWRCVIHDRTVIGSSHEEPIECDGPPTQQEIDEEEAERDFDRGRDEGRW